MVVVNHQPACRFGGCGSSGCASLSLLCMDGARKRAGMGELENYSRCDLLRPFRAGTRTIDVAQARSHEARVRPKRVVLSSHSKNEATDAHGSSILIGWVEVKCWIY